MEYQKHFIIKLRTLLLQSKWFYFFFIISIVFSIIFTKTILIKSKFSISQNNFIFTIIKYKIDEDKLTLELKNKETIIGNYYFKTIKEKENFLKSYQIGDTLILEGQLQNPKNNTIPNVFNYKKYLYNKRIFFILNIEKFELYKKNNNLFLNFKNYFYNKINSIQYNKYLYAFILGEKSYISSKIFNTYQNNGITHLFALSGLHVSVLSSIILFFLNKTALKEIFKYIIVFIFLILLAFITGFPPSILRASLLFFLIGINKAYYFYIKTSDLLLICGTLLMVLNPFIIYELSFQLSFIITYFILINTNWFKNKYIISLLKVSFISFLASLPIIINNFYSVNLFSVLNNLFFVPYVTFIVYPLSLIVYLIPKLDFIFNMIILIMEKVSILLNKIDLFNLYIPKMDFSLIIFYYIFLILFSFKNRKYIIIIVLIFLLNYFIPNFNKSTYIYFLDVGQGDSSLIVTENNKSILIDTGGKLNYNFDTEFKNRNNTFSLMSDSLIPFYKSIGLKRIDYLFFTHGDEDHIGYAEELINNFKVKKIYINNGEINSYERKLNKFEILDTNYLKIDNIKIYFLNNKIYNNENDNSVIMLVIIDDIKILYLGDASKKVETEILNKYDLNDIDILKVGHHGSKTSTSEALIKAIKPKFSIISVGDKNKFNHPSIETIELLNKYNTSIYETKKYGSIVFKLDERLYFKEYKP